MATRVMIAVAMIVPEPPAMAKPMASSTGIQIRSATPMPIPMIGHDAEPIGCGGGGAEFRRCAVRLVRRDGRGPGIL